MIGEIPSDDAAAPRRRQRRGVGRSDERNLLPEHRETDTATAESNSDPSFTPLSMHRQNPPPPDSPEAMEEIAAGTGLGEHGIQAAPPRRRRNGYHSICFSKSSLTSLCCCSENKVLITTRMVAEREMGRLYLT